jgi:hypothetical protein
VVVEASYRSYRIFLPRNYLLEKMSLPKTKKKAFAVAAVDKRVVGYSFDDKSLKC